MYSRRLMLILRVFSAALSVVMELLTFYYLFLQFSIIFSGSKPKELVTNDMIFHALISVMAVFAHELIEMVIDLGDRLEAKGETVWKETGVMNSQMKQQSL
jgi:hypothetical protein